MPKRKTLCKFSDEKICIPSKEAYEKGYRKDIIPCNSTHPEGCTIYLKLSNGQTIEDLFGIT